MILASDSKKPRSWIWTSGLAVFLCAAFAARGQLPVMKRSDVVFMYETGRQTYEDYGATVLAWGGKPTAKSIEQARGLKFFGSVGMVTEFGRYYERFPQTYEQGLCRGLDGQPYKVPWLTDLQHKGIPFWWCCTRQPLFRQYISERVVETVKAGADGVHIDDHLGTAGALWTGGCFCDRCVEEFHDYLKGLPASELARQGIQDPAGFNYRTVLREWVAQKRGRKPQEHPLWSQWRIYQLQGAARFMEELRALAARTAGHPIPMGANAGLLWGNHLNDYKALDLFSAEIEHHASDRHFSDAPLVAYRLADAVGRPLASTASGWDWAYVKEHNLPGLVQGWIALGYAAGHCLMAPNRQWCYTPEKGTHWYEGPKEKFAPFYQFVRQHGSLFDDYGTYADLTVVFSSRTFDRDPARLIAACGELAAANVSYCLALSGDEVVDHPLKADDLRLSPRLVVIEPPDLSPADREVLAGETNVQRYASIREAIAGIAPAARVKSPAAVRVLPRVKRGSAIVHLLNWGYDAANDSAQPLKNVRLDLDLDALGVAGATEADLFSPGAQPIKLPVTNRGVTVPELELWSVIEIHSTPIEGSKNNASPAPKLEDLPLKDSVSQYGITWTFETPAHAGRFVNGDWYVVGPVSVVKIDPAPRYGKEVADDDLDGREKVPVDQRCRNGSMLNLPARQEVAWDSAILNYYRPEHRARLPVAMKPGDSLASSISLRRGEKVTYPYHPGTVRGVDDNSPVKTVAVLTCVEAPLPPDAFRPGYSGHDPKIHLARDLKRDLLPRFDHAAGAPDPARFAENFQRPWCDTGFFSFDVPQQSMPNYAQWYAQGPANAVLLACCAGTSPEDQERLLINVIQIGIDHYGLVRQGHPGWPAHGGHGSGRKFPIVFAGAMLGDDTMANINKSFPKAAFGEDEQTAYGDCWTGAKVVFTGHSGIDVVTGIGRDFVRAGNPWGPYEHLPPDKWVPEEFRSDAYRRANTSTCFVAQALVLRTMNLEKAWAHDAFFDYVDRWMFEDDKPFRIEIAKYCRPPYNPDDYLDETKDWFHEGYADQAWVKQLWNKYRPLCPAPTDGWKQKHDDSYYLNAVEKQRKR